MLWLLNPGLQTTSFLRGRHGTPHRLGVQEPRYLYRFSIVNLTIRQGTKHCSLFSRSASIMVEGLELTRGTPIVSKYNPCITAPRPLDPISWVEIRTLLWADGLFVVDFECDVYDCLVCIVFSKCQIMRYFCSV